MSTSDGSSCNTWKELCGSGRPRKLPDCFPGDGQVVQRMRQKTSVASARSLASRLRTARPISATDPCPADSSSTPGAFHLCRHGHDRIDQDRKINTATDAVYPYRLRVRIAVVEVGCVPLDAKWPPRRETNNANARRSQCRPFLSRSSVNWCGPPAGRLAPEQAERLRQGRQVFQHDAGRYCCD